MTSVVAGPGSGAWFGWCSWWPYSGFLDRMSGNMYSSLRYLFPEQARGDDWSSRFAKTAIRGWLRGGFRGVREGRGWIGDGCE